MSDVPSWAPAPQKLPACGLPHDRAGRRDETARRLDHPEWAVARRLVAEGHDVVTVPERGGRGPVPDFMVCGQPVEVKALLTVSERTDGRRATAATVHNRLVSAVDQAGVVVVATAGSGCRAADAAAGVRSFVATRRTGRVGAVRVMGDGFDLSWQASPVREVGRGATPAPPPEPARPRRPERPIELP
jgi:hypothetical protein